MKCFGHKLLRKQVTQGSPCITTPQDRFGGGKSSKPGFRNGLEPVYTWTQRVLIDYSDNLKRL